MTRIKNLLFDLDGTIIAPEEGIVNSLIYAFEKLGEPIPDRAELLQFIGPPLIDSFSERYRWPIDQINEAIAHYRERFAEKGVFENHLYEGIREVLQTFYTQNYRIFLATSKPTIFAKQILERFELNSLFEGIVGSNLDNTRGQKAEIIDFVLKTYQLKVGESLMIGDRLYDIKGAKSHDLLAIGVTYGHGDQAELTQAGADHIITDCRDLISLIPKL